MKSVFDNMALIDRIKRMVSLRGVEPDWSYGSLGEDHVLVRDNGRGLDFFVDRDYYTDGRQTLFAHRVEVYRGQDYVAGAIFNMSARFSDVFNYILEGGGVAV